MNGMKIKIKRLTLNAIVPSYAKDGDAGMDLTTTEVSYNSKTDTIDYSTGLSIEIPKGYVGLIFPRSSIRKKDLMLSNHVGVIDSGYRGEIKASFRLTKPYWSATDDYTGFERNLEKGVFLHYDFATDEARDNIVESSIYGVGDRICQLMIIPYPQIEFEEVDELSDTERGENGFGSTGK